MKTNKILFTFIFSFISIISLQAQTAYEAIRYAQNTIGGTARTMGAGGAFGAVGADFGGVSINPAGLGLYRRSEISISPVLNTVTNEATYYSSRSTESNYNFAMSNFGLVINNNRPPREKPTGIVTSSIVFGVNRLNSYFDDRYISGFNTDNSLTDRYTQNAQGTAPELLNDFEYDLYQTGFLNVYDNDGEYVYDNPLSGNLQQREANTVTGGMNEFVMGFGANYEDRLYFGATLGIPYFSYNSNAEYQEEDTEGNYTDSFQSLSTNESLNVDGYGFNGKFGVIFRLSNAFRLGAALHTANYLRLNEEFRENQEAVIITQNVITTIYSPTYANYFNYRLRTPGKTVLSATYFYKKLGLLSVDYEYVNYSKARYETALDGALEDKDFFAGLNEEIGNSFKGASNLRVGVEIAPKIFRVRAGYAFDGNPQENTTLQTGRHTYTVGAGVRGKKVSLDIAYNTSTESYNQSLYGLVSGTTAAAIKNKRNNIVATFALRLR